MKWHEGRPPSKGWRIASYARDPRILRWWNGRYWSQGVRDNEPAHFAARRARQREYDCIFRRIEWAERPANWPDRSRT